jgi:hypothetical protein
VVWRLDFFAPGYAAPPAALEAYSASLIEVTGKYGKRASPMG